MAEKRRGLPPRACTFAQRQRHLPEQAERFSVSAAIACSCDREASATLPAGPLFSPGQGLLSADPDRTNRTPLLRFRSLQHSPAKRRHCPKGRQPLEDHPVAALPNSRRLNGGGWLVSRSQLAVLTVFRLTRLTIRAFSSVGLASASCPPRILQPSHGAIFGIGPQSRAFARLVGTLIPDGALGIFRPSQSCSCLAGVGAFPPVRAHMPLFAFIHPDHFFIGRRPSCSQTNLNL